MFCQCHLYYDASVPCDMPIEGSSSILVTSLGERLLCRPDHAEDIAYNDPETELHDPCPTCRATGHLEGIIPEECPSCRGSGYVARYIQHNDFCERCGQRIDNPNYSDWPYCDGCSGY